MQLSGFTSLRQTQPLASSPFKSVGTGPKVDADLPDISGMCPHDQGALAVTDAKLESDRARLGLIDGRSGQFQAIPTDWARTGKARDLEAITAVEGQQGHYMAVEGSSWNGTPNHIFDLKIDGEGATAERKFDLPPLSQEIEGLVQKKLDDQRSLLILGGRGGENGEAGRLFWGVLDNNSGELTFSDAGREGMAVQAPRLNAPGQRDISELQLRPDGSLWASAAVDNGNEGPFEAKLYQVGTLTGREDIPVALGGNQNSSQSLYTKVEGFASWGGGLLTGSDNESLGGEIGFLIAH